MDNTLKRAILQFQANKEGCDSILCGYTFKNQSKAYRVNPDPTTVRAVIPVHTHGLRKSFQVHTMGCGGGMYISVPKIIFRWHILIFLVNCPELGRSVLPQQSC